MNEGWSFDVDEVFDDDYLYFYETILTEEVSDGQAALIRRLLELEEGSTVLDLACGHGRISNRLAAEGAEVIGLDATPRFLDRARRDAQARGVEVDYVEGDMRELPWEEAFDAVTCVFASYGYFDVDNRRVLAAARRALKPGGRFWLDINHLPWLLKNFRDEIVIERDGQWMIDPNRCDPLLGRTINRRTVIRSGAQRTFEFSVRVLTFTEIRDWLLDAGFGEVDGFSGGGEQLTIDEPRMVVVARS